MRRKRKNTGKSLEPKPADKEKIPFQLVLTLIASGFSALLLQTIWFRQAKQLFGSSTISTSLVLAAFMTGNSLGGLFAMSFSNSRFAPKRLLGICLVTTGFAGAILTILLPKFTILLAPVFRLLLQDLFWLNLLRFILAFCFMLIPSLGMGATIPFAVSAAFSASKSFATNIGMLYSANTLGGVIGALAGEFVLFSWLGLTTSAIFGVSITTILGIWLIIKKPVSERPFSNESSDEKPQINGYTLFLIATTLTTGIVFMALEVIWFRFLQLFTIPSSPIFAGILAIILTAMAIGSGIFTAFLAKRPQSLRFFPFMLIFSGLWLVISYSNFATVYQVSGGVKISGIYELFICTIFLVLPISLFSGATFPLLGSALKTELKESLKASGMVSGFNMLGAAIGPVIAGVFLIPTFGIEKSFFVVGLCLMLIGAAAAFFLREAKSFGPVQKFSPLVIIVLTLFFFPFGKMKQHYNLLSLAEHYQPQHQIIGFWEGVNENIVLTEEKLAGHKLMNRLITNGFSMSGTNHFSRRYMSMFAALPLAIHPEPEKALLICYGVGVTARALTAWPELNKIKIVEISPDVPEASRQLLTASETSPLDDPRVELLIEDGRFFLQTNEEKFDIITAEPPPPKHDGVEALYSQDFFAQVYTNLLPGGYFSLWLPVKQLSLADAQAIVQAFIKIFPDASLWCGAGPDLILLGYKPPLKPVSQNRYDLPWLTPEYREILLDIFLEKPPQLASCFLAGAQDLAEFCGNTPPLTDDFPYRLSPFSNADFAGEISQMLQPETAKARFVRAEFIKKLLPMKVREAALNWYPLQRIHYLALSRQDWEMAFDVLYNTLTLTNLEVLPLYIMGVDPKFLESLEKFPELTKNDPMLPIFFGIQALSHRNYNLAIKMIQFPKTSIKLPKSVIARVAGFRIIALCLAGQNAEAASFLAQLQQLSGGQIFPRHIENFFYRVINR